MLRYSCLFLLAGSLCAQAPSVSIRLDNETNQTEFRVGETIGLMIAFDNLPRTPLMMMTMRRDRFVTGPEGERFAVVPAEGTSDPMQYRFGGPIAFSGSILGGDFPEKTTTLRHVDLNQWVRFEKPGFYRVHGLFPSQGTVLESNDIGIEIIPADKEWQARTLREAADTIGTPEQNNNTFDKIMNAARQIGYLDTPESIRQSAILLGTAAEQVSQILRTWLDATARPDEAIATMNQLLRNPGQPVTRAFLDALAALEARAGTTGQPRADLEKAVERKHDRAKAISMKTLIDTMPAQAAPEGVRRETAQLFAQLPEGQQSELLGSQWPKIAGPDMIPVLRKMYDNLPDAAYPPAYPKYPLVATAVERLYELDPAQGRKIILEEMQRPDPRLPFQTLAILSDTTLPEMDRILAEHLTQNHANTELIARYATPAILDPVMAFYTKRTATGQTCDAAMVAYLLRADPPYGERVLQNLMASPGGCRMEVLGRIAAFYVSPEWEKAAIAALQDGVVNVKADAVKALGQYGSPASEAAVWDAFNYWHNYWKDKQAQLDYERRFEQVFLEAFAHAKNWNVTSADMQRVRDLCITDDCRRRADEFERNWK